MTEKSLQLSDINGLLPSVEPAGSDKLFALSGQNYLFDTKGPFSAFGNQLLLPQAFEKPDYAQGIRVKLRSGAKCFTFTSDSMLEWDEVAGGWQVLYVIPDTITSPYRWTWGYLNGYIYFCHPRTGILVYEVESGQCFRHTDVGIATPEGALAIAIDNGVLGVLTPIHFAWSAPSNGLDFTPTLGGAGFQLISDRVGGYPVMITSYTKGCLIWTTEGVMRSEFTGDQAVFRHRALQTSYRPVNPFCVCKSDQDTVIILDERGLFQSKGESPEPLTPLFNEFLLGYIQDNDINVNNNIRLEWDELQRRLYLSTSLSQNDSRFENCFVLYPNLDKWGQFNETHYGIMPFLIQESSRADDYYGFVDSEGLARLWRNSGWREVSPSASTTHDRSNLYYPVIQKPANMVTTEGVTILSSSAIMNTFNTIVLSSWAGFYPDDGFYPEPAERTGLDSFLRVGLFRLADGPTSDRLTEVTFLAIHNPNINNTFTGTGFNNEPTELTGAKFPGEVPDTIQTFLQEEFVNHNVKLIGSIDGRTSFMSQVPSLVDYTRGIRYYSCAVTGIWHILEVSAELVGESFHLSAAEFTSIDAGRL